MNVTEITNQISTDNDDTVQVGTVIGWVNRVIADLSRHAQYEKKTTLSITEGTPDYSLPSDFVRLNTLADNTTDTPYIYGELQRTDFTSKGYRIIGSTISFQGDYETADLDMFYVASIPFVTGGGDTPAIRADFHDMFVLYGTAKAKYVDEEEALHSIYMQEYNRRRQDFIDEMTQSKPKEAIEIVFGAGWL